MCIWWSPDENLIEWCEVPLLCHFKKWRKRALSVWAFSINISSPWELMLALNVSGLRTPCGLSLSLSLGLRGPMELCQTRAPCAIRVWIEKIYALNGIAANSCLYAPEQTKGMFDVWLCATQWCKKKEKEKNFPLRICVHLTETTAISLAFGSNDQMQDVIKHLSANVIFYACDYRLYLYNTV